MSESVWCTQCSPNPNATQGPLPLAPDPGTLIGVVSDAKIEAYRKALDDLAVAQRKLYAAFQESARKGKGQTAHAMRCETKVRRMFVEIERALNIAGLETQCSHRLYSAGTDNVE